MKIMLEPNVVETGTQNNCQCDVCGKRFHRKPSQIEKSKRHYCSVACHAAAKALLMRGAGNHQYGRPENLAVLSHAEHQRLHLNLNMHGRNEKGQFEKETPDTIKVKRVTETAVVPERKSIGAAGFDLCADITESVVIRPGETVLIYSGIAFAIPKNYFGAIYARSGLATRCGLRPATCVSVIDSDYRGKDRKSVV